MAQAKCFGVFSGEVEFSIRGRLRKLSINKSYTNSGMSALRFHFGTGLQVRIANGNRIRLMKKNRIRQPVT